MDSATSSSSSFTDLFLYQEEGSRDLGEFPSRRNEYFPVEPPSHNKNEDSRSRNSDRHLSSSFEYLTYNDDDNDDDNEFRHPRRNHASGNGGGGDGGGNNGNNNSHRTADAINSVLRASRTSFRNVEEMTYGVFDARPLLALGIFVTAGTVVAYILGFFFLGGYIDNWNPVENDVVPYWDEPEIHTIKHVVGK